MHLLFLTPQLPYPPFQGATIRNFNLIRELAQRHTVDLLTFLAPGESLTADSPLLQLCRRVATVPQPARPAAPPGPDDPAFVPARYGAAPGKPGHAPTGCSLGGRDRL